MPDPRDDSSDVPTTGDAVVDALEGIEAQLERVADAQERIATVLERATGPVIYRQGVALE